MNSWALAHTRDVVASLHGARLAVPFEGWCITTVDPHALLVSSVVADNPAHPMLGMPGGLVRARART